MSTTLELAKQFGDEIITLRHALPQVPVFERELPTADVLCSTA